MTIKIEKLDKAGYRKFGLTTGAIVAALFGALLPWLFEFDYHLWPWIFFAVFALVGLLFPLALQPVYYLWMRFGMVMNWINTRLILGLLFYGIFFPIGLFFRLIGRDAMRRKFDSKVASYRHRANQDSNDNMEHPY
ncbi:MAG: SxtJ family membrane protein [Gammaproteobacteria bacterium]|nr:SxtJ family membrane protein [Gammaproteobacteria bacterium]